MIPSWLADAEQVRYVHHRHASSGTRAPWPGWLPETIRERLVAHGIAQPWQHQVTAAEAAFRGSPVAIATGTASGKTLAYLLPIMAATACGGEGVIGVPTSGVRSAFTKPTRQHTALYLAPTKALAHDQLRTAKALGGSEWRVTTLDGDSDDQERCYARDVATYVLTNPDMVHRAILPRHQRWASFLRSLRYIVVDESHRYRGVFGSQVAAVLRRLRRVCALYGASPVIICASATSSAPAQAAARLIGVDSADVVSVTHDSSAKPALDVVLWEPEMSLYADAS
ncbi:MAG: DEAD/DEAH box helicase, partial [Propionibacteriaceae bacterium]